MDMKQMMKQAQKMQVELEKAQAEAAMLTAESSTGGGMVKVVAVGNMEVKSITIDPSVVDPEDVEMLQDLILTAVNEAFANVQELVNTRISAVTGGMNIPGL
jgi:DNA-binding YbaB/EbfC family protein